MRIGNENRSIGYTDMNAQSSRSHSVFIVTVTSENSVSLVKKTGKLYLVDLAGSEKIAKTGAVGQTLEEAKTINKSLSTLGLVINSLTDGKSTHVPYRDSKLTRVLQESLGGNSRTALIITCSPARDNEEETTSTLKFGQRAKNIKNKPKMNKDESMAELKKRCTDQELLIERLKLKVEQLERKLANHSPVKELSEKSLDSLSDENLLEEENLLKESYKFMDIPEILKDDNPVNNVQTFSHPEKDMPESFIP
jgi:kinesin family protein 5